MKNLLFTLSVLSIFTWIIGYFWFHQSPFIHIFLITAFVTAGGWFSFGRTILVK